MTNPKRPKLDPVTLRAVAELILEEHEAWGVCRDVYSDEWGPTPTASLLRGWAKRLRSLATREEKRR